MKYYSKTRTKVSVWDLSRGKYEKKVTYTVNNLGSQICVSDFDLAQTTK